MCPHWILFHHDLNPLSIRLYLVFRQHADAKGDSFPSRRRLADLLHVSLPTLDKARQQLIDVGALTMDRRKGAGDEWLSCIYRVHWEPGGKESCPPLVKVFTPPSQETSTRTKTQVTHTEDLRSLHHTANSPSPSDAPTVNNAAGGTVTPDPPGEAVSVREAATFEDFWAIYPRRQGRKAAQDAWGKAVKGMDPGDIIAGAHRYATDPNREDAFTALPTTWLNQGRWDDEPLPARTPRQQTGGERRMDAYAALAAKVRQRGITA